eukprot:UN04846
MPQVKVTGQVYSSENGNNDYMCGAVFEIETYDYKVTYEQTYTGITDCPGAIPGIRKANAQVLGKKLERVQATTVSCGAAPRRKSMRRILNTQSIFEVIVQAETAEEANEVKMT